MFKGKKILLAVMTAAIVLSMAIGAGLVSASEAVTLGNNSYALSDAFDVRLSYNADGELNAANNGLRVKAKISAEDYAELSKLNNETTLIKYGILLAPADYAKANALTEANVFGKNRVYSTNAVQAAEDKDNGKETKRIECVEEAELAEGADGYYMYLLLSDLDTTAIMRDYTAKAYIVKYTIGESGILTDEEYAFVDGEKELNTVYAVQKAIEDGKVNDYNDDLQSAYVDGKTQKITVEYVTSYDGVNPSTVSNEYEFAVGSTVTKEDVLAKLTEVDPSAYDMTTEFVSQKIYAGKKDKISFAFSPKKAESVTAAIGMYIAGEDNVEIKENTLSSNVYEDVAYTLFRDGTVVVNGENGKEILGKVNFDEKQFVLGEKVLPQVLELEKSVYAKLAGYYVSDEKVVKLNADGTCVFDLLGAAETVKYMLTYDEANGRYIAAFANSVIKTLTLGSTPEIAGFEAVKLGSEADYNGIADYYICSTEGDNLNKVYRFNVDGSIVENGAEVGSFMIFDDGTISSAIGGNVYSVTRGKKDYNFGLTIKELTLKDSTDTVAMTLKNENLADYEVLYKRANNLFGYAERKMLGIETAADAKGNPTSNGNLPRLTLTNQPTEVTALQAEATCDGKPLWKNAEYGMSKWGNVLRSAGKKLLSYYLEPKSPTTGIVHFRIHKIDDQSLVRSKDVAYEIDDQYQLHIDMTDFDPHGLGNIGQYQKVVADISTNTYGSYNIAKNIYNVFGSEEGTYYYPTEYRVADATSSAGSLRLYNFHTEIESMKDEYYACEFWGAAGAYIQGGFEKTKIAYKLEYDQVKNVGKLTIGRADGARWEYTIGIVNGNRFIDMRVKSLAGYTPFDNVKVAVSENAARDIAAIEYAITTVNKTFENAGKVTEPTEDTRTIYEKIAGTYKSGKYYNETSSWWWGIGFTLNADGTMIMTNNLSDVGSYEIREITDTFGEIIIDCSYSLVKRDGYVHVGYYALIDGQYIFRITNCTMKCAKWAFWDFTPAGSSFTTWSVFDEMVGEGTEYTDGSATLTLNKLGPKPDETKESYKGASFTLTDGEVTINGNYDLVPTAHGAGKLFMDITTEPEASRYIIGEYKLMGDKYVLVFTVNTATLSKTYMMSVGGLEVAYEQVKGAYFGAESITFTNAAEVKFSSVSAGTISENGITANFVIESGRVKIVYVKNGLDYVAVK